MRYAPLTLTTLASLIPREIPADVALLDEGVDEIDPGAIDADLVGITVITGTAPRAYELAREFRQRNIPVVLGGVHPTLVPEEAVGHADSVVVGYAEESWPQLLRDFVAGCMQRRYDQSPLLKLDGLPFPRRDLYTRGMVNVSDTIEATRGCIFQCEFCVVPAAWGTRPLQKPVGDVIADLRQMGARRAIFLDLNLIADVPYARELFTALIPLKLRWAGLVTTTIAWDEELLDLAARSGCRGLLIGFESLDQKALDETRKSFNMRKDYHLVVDRIHDRGIAIMGCFVFGFDSDTLETFDRTVDFVMESRMDLPRYAIAVPFPATGPVPAPQSGEPHSDRGLVALRRPARRLRTQEHVARRVAAPHRASVEEDLSVQIDRPARAGVGHPDDDFGRSQSRLSLLRQQPRQVLYMRLAARSRGVRGRDRR